MIDVIKNMPEIKIKIVEDGKISDSSSTEIGKNKRIIIFGVPGAFTSTCSEKHLPGYIDMAITLKSKGIESIYCLAVNDPYVMQAWQSQYKEGNKVNMIADGNSDLTKSLELDKDYSSSFMGIRSKRFSLLADNNKINVLNIEKPGEFKISSAEYIINQI
ncbi:MAG: Hybrid peroxiredoxin hyPrx5 [Alphaproteobacteria bacterium MarineAlpha5_Bin12]|nr:peroxiredoxin [Pelagibacteraceae bacterium]PPR41254.1 MAG: Hybrid peroxiredoxin hyPrx5 [Alphaproteobacteria bacterium MarineAlpha5_Bin12]|tara:strand:- start:3607 stop:4086 length:480 start_codon:yes stop_codon:yes gene_type:complete